MGRAVTIKVPVTGGSGAASGFACCGAGSTEAGAGAGAGVGWADSCRSVSAGGSSTATPPCSSASVWAVDCPFPEPTGSIPKRTLSLSATSSSIELECVNFSDTPKSGRSSKIKWDFTSSSRARTLIRIFFINELNISVEIPNLRVLRPSHPEIASKN